MTDNGEKSAVSPINGIEPPPEHRFTEGNPGGPGAPKGPRWSTLFNKCLDLEAKEEWAELVRQMGMSPEKEKITIRMAMIAKSIQRYMGGDNQGDPRTLSMIMDREDGKPATPIVGPNGGPVVVFKWPDMKEDTE